MSILGEVLRAKAGANLEEFNDTMSKVEGKIVTMKTELVEALQSCFVLFDSDIDRITTWSTQVNEVDSQVKGLLEQFYAEKELYVNSINDIEDVDSCLSKSLKDVETLVTLVTVVENCEQADERINELEASLKIKRACKEYTKLEEDFKAPEDRKWLASLHNVLSTATVNIFSRVQKEWNDKFRFKRNQLSIDQYGAEAIVMLETLTNLNYLDKIWSRFTSQLWTEIFSKVSCPEYSVRVSIPVMSDRADLTLNSITGGASFSELDDVPVRDVSSASTVRVSRGSEATTLMFDKHQSQVKSRLIIEVDKLENPIKNVAKVLKNIMEVLQVLANLFNEQPQHMSSLGKRLGPQICSSLSKSLKQLVLKNSEGNIEAARLDIESLTQFLVQMEVLGFSTDTTVLREFTTDFESLFSKQLRQDICTKSRDYILADLHKTMRYFPPAPSPRHLTHPRELIKSPYTLQQSMEISVSIYEMVMMLQQHLLDHPNDDLLADHAFSIYLAVVCVPKNEADASDLVPLQAAIIHNNSWFLSHHAQNFNLCEHHIPLLRAKADQAQAFLLRSIRSKLNNMIGNAVNGLEGKVDAKIDCSLDFLLISEELNRFDQLFKTVLPAFAWKRSLSLLVDHTVNEIVHKVLQWDDISANTATELAAAFIKFGVEVSHLFKGEARAVREIDAITQKAVKNWQRFRLLTFVLTASMSEIGDKWVQGCGPLALEFSADEIRRLVRALFQNTDRRAAFLSTIK